MNTCANCKHYHAFYGEQKGECWYNPPTVYGFGVGCRPRVKATEACAHHEIGEAQVKGKVNGETPAQAVKAARKEKPKVEAPAITMEKLLG